MDKEAVFSKLEEIGAARVVVGYSGGHDSGGADFIRITLGDGSTKDIYEWTPEDSDQTDEEKQLAEMLAAPVYEQYGSFCGEFSVDGEIIYDLADRTVVMSGNESVESWETVHQEF